MVFYRKYRPQKFSSVIGQEHIKTTLANSLMQGNFSHGYLFAGPRGSGKTTLARIFAKALNCTGRKLGKDSFEPCNKCASCLEITNGHSMDTIEIDAASNRGIDEIRELREKIKFSPTKSLYKVYIIDEVHMLTKEAFNALLKTLEEPPKHAIFVMATTEPHKILPTILSRVQRFDFHKATTKEITALLKKVAAKEELKIEDEALTLLAQMSFGAYRDGLSLLDQVASTVKKNEMITLEKVQSVLGLAHEESIFEFIALLAAKDRSKLYSLISKLYFQGVDLEHFTTSLVEVLRKMALFKLGEDQLFDFTKEQQEKIKALAEKIPVGELMPLIEKFIAAIPKVKSGNIPQLPLEMIIFESTQNEEVLPLLPEEVSVLPKKVFDPGTVIVRQADEKISKDQKEVKTNRQTMPFNKELWPEIVKKTSSHNHNLAAMLRDAAISKIEDKNIFLAFKFKFHANMISNRKNTDAIEKIIEDLTGERYILSCLIDPELVIKVPEDDETQLLNGVTEVFEVEG